MTNKNKEAIKLIKIVRDCGGYRNTEGFAFTDAFNVAIKLLEKQEKLEAMKNEDEAIEYLSACSKDALIDLFLQMRFERDLYMEMYERREEE